MNFTDLAVAPPDPILSLIVRFANDDFPQKVDLGAGAYRTEEGKPYVFDCVRQAEAEVVGDHTLNKEYQP
jgi:aspartate aminotransferase, cytoplasmic